MSEIETKILTAITEHQRLAVDFAYMHDAKLFLSRENRIIASHFINYIKTYRSKPTERTTFAIIKDPQEVEIFRRFWSEQSGAHYNEADYNFDVDRLKEQYSKRLLENLEATFTKHKADPVKDKIKLIDNVVTEVKAVNQRKTFERKTLKEYVPEFKENYIAKFNNPELGCGIMTGYSFLDFVKNGMRPADLLLICAETGAGKSMWLNNMAVNMWMQKNKIDTNPDEFTQGYNVMYFSLEMPQEDCFRRTVSQMSDIPSYGVRDARLNTYEAKALAKSLKFMEKYPYEFDIIDVPRGFTVEELELHFEEAKSRYHPDVIFIDYLGLMEDIDNGGEEQDWLKLGQLTGKVHEFARAYQIPILSAVQLNRLEKGKKINPIGLHRIGRSSMIAHHATAILQIENRENEFEMPDFIYHIIKNRDGELGYHTIDKNFACSRITDKPYDSSNRVNYLTSVDDISGNISDIIGNILGE